MDTGEVGAHDEPKARERAVAILITEVLRRRVAGEILTESQLIAERPDLMPELAEGLASLNRVHQSYLAARKAGVHQEPLQLLKQTELDAPIELPEDDDEPSSSIEDTTGVVVAADAPRSYAPAIEGYHIVGELGSGGQGTVFKAVQISTSRTVAVKVMLGGALAGSRHRARFEREVAILAGIEHPNVVDVLDRGCAADGSFFFVMGHVDGVPFDEHVRTARNSEAGQDTGEAGLTQTVRLFVKVCRAVAEAHRRGVVHRDLKPSNILVDRRGEPHVMDFGLARPLGSIPVESEYRATVRTLTGQIVGSLPWASPEQVTGTASVEYPSDVYSLGVVFYEALTGRPPYSVDGPVGEVLNNIATVIPGPPSLSITRRGSSGSAKRRVLSLHGDGRLEVLDVVLLKALAKRPSDRYINAAAFADDLDAYLQGRKTVASPPRPCQKPWARPLGWRAALLACGIAAAFVGGWRVYRTHRQLQYTVLSLPKYTNSIGMQFVRLTSQPFLAGSPPGEPGRAPTEWQQTASIDHPINFGVTEVTQGQYQAVMGSNPSDPRYLGNNLPVQCVSWDDAQLFCRKLGEREGRFYRLPTEVEWEYACRAGSREAFSGTGTLEDMGWFKENSGSQLHPVASKFPNGWGLYDLHGGVAEWCEDDALWATSRPSAAKEPTRPMPIDPATRDSKGQRGGDFTGTAAVCRSASRHSAPHDARSPTVGFRVVLEDTEGSLVAPAITTAPATPSLPQ